MRWFRALAVLSIGLVAAACGSSGGTEPTPPGGGAPTGGGATGVTVRVGNNVYSPGQVSVARGTTVTWHWDSCTGDPYGGQVCAFHSVTFDDAGPSAAARNEGSFSRAFNNAGTFTYHCTSHGRAAMSGSVVVQ